MANPSCPSHLIEALLNPTLYPHPAKTVRLLETHISWVLLAGRYAYKIKKPVDFGFLNFTESNQRRFYCEEEIRLNRRLAPKIYLDVVFIGGNPMEPVFGTQPAFEYAIRMRRFSSGKLLNQLLKDHRLTLRHIDRLATTIANFHTTLPPTTPDSCYGKPEAIAEPARQNFQQLATLLSNSDMAMLTKLQGSSEMEFGNCLTLLEQRQRTGFIRECHGDLHLGNIVLLKDQPTPFDGIEFDPKLRWIDIINDIAFLIMDLQYLSRADLAFRFLNAYLEVTGDYQGLGVLRFYLGYRAMVRAKIAAIRASQTAEDTAMDECRSYLAHAGDCLTKAKPALIITHGLPGCGKTTISQIILEKLQAIRLRSDVERKRLFGLAAHQNSGGNIYDPLATKRTYEHLRQLALEVLSLSFPVIVDAAFLKYAERRQFLELAHEMNLPFIILSIRAESTLLHQRIRQRQQVGNDASEADQAVLEKLQAASEPLQADELDFTIEFVNDTEIANIDGQHSAWDRLNVQLNIAISGK